MPDYVGMAQRDPDGTAIRLSLSRRVTINTMTAAERIFIASCPMSGQGAAAASAHGRDPRTGRGARAAERALRAAAADAAKKKPAGARARVGAADFRALRVRNARWCQRVLRC